MAYIILFLIVISVSYLIKRINLDVIKKWLGIESPSHVYKRVNDEIWANYIDDIFKNLKAQQKQQIHINVGHASKDGDKNEP